MKVTYPAVAAIDIGTFTVTVVIARWIHTEQKFDVIGLASKPNLGMQKGQITDLDKLAHSISLAVAEAEDMANSDIHSAYIAMPSVGMYSTNVSGTAFVENGQVTMLDIAKAFEIAKTKRARPDLYLISTHRLGIEIDDNEQLVSDPTGMRAQKITSHFHMMLMPVATMQNIEKSVKLSGKEVEQTTLSMVANAEAALTEQEKEIGVCLLDIGGSSTDVAVYLEGKMVLSFTEPCGGDNVTRDIAMKFNVDLAQAEKIKCKHACVDISSVKADQNFVCYDVHSKEPTPKSRLELVQVTVACYEDMLDAVYRKLADAGIIGVKCGVVLTGGGSQVEGIEPFIKRFFGIERVHKYAHPVSVTAEPKLLTELQRMSYSTAAGLLLYSQKYLTEDNVSADGFLVPRTTGFIYKYIIAPWMRFKMLFQKLV